MPNAGAHAHKIPNPAVRWRYRVPSNASHAIVIVIPTVCEGLNGKLDHFSRAFSHLIEQQAKHRKQYSDHFPKRPPRRPLPDWQSLPRTWLHPCQPDS
jgi:hypothetical protein